MTLRQRTTMKKQDYIDKMIEISMRREQLNKEEEELKNTYINASDATQFKVGEKVLVHKKTSIEAATLYGFVEGYRIDSFTSEVVLVLCECKKDGTPSKRKLNYYPWYGDKVEKII